MGQARDFARHAAQRTAHDLRAQHTSLPCKRTAHTGPGATTHKRCKKLASVRRETRKKSETENSCSKRAKRSGSENASTSSTKKLHLFSVAQTCKRVFSLRAYSRALRNVTLVGRRFVARRPAAASLQATHGFGRGCAPRCPVDVYYTLLVGTSSTGFPLHTGERTHHSHLASHSRASLHSLFSLRAFQNAPLAMPSCRSGNHLRCCRLHDGCRRCRHVCVTGRRQAPRLNGALMSD